MSEFIRIGLASALVLATGAAQAATPPVQQDDDWELVADPARGLTAAAVRYDDGKAIVVQCAPAGLRVVLVGLPASTEQRRVVTATRADGRSDTQTWFAQPGATSFTASVSGRDARFLRGGGGFELRSATGAAAPLRATFDLPTQNANLDRALTACGYAVQDERDLVPRTGPDLKTAWEAEQEAERAAGPGRPENPRSRSVSGPGRARNYTPPPPTPADISCVIKGGAATDCRPDRTLETPSPETERWVRYLQGPSRLDPPGAAANEGRIYYPFAVEIPLIMVRREAM